MSWKEMSQSQRASFIICFLWFLFLCFMFLSGFRQFYLFFMFLSCSFVASLSFGVASFLICSPFWALGFRNRSQASGF